MSSISPINSSSDIQTDYMKLLVTQLQNQNPFEPIDNNQMAMQLTQFSQLQQLENMNSNFQQTLLATQLNYANSLIGKEVHYGVIAPDGTPGIETMQVEQVLSDNGEIRLADDQKTIALNDVLSIKG